MSPDDGQTVLCRGSDRTGQVQIVCAAEMRKRSGALLTGPAVLVGGIIVVTALIISTGNLCNAKSLSVELEDDADSSSKAVAKTKRSADKPKE